MIKRVLLAIVALVLLLAAAVAANTLRQGSRQLEVPPAPPLAVDAQAVADKLAGALRFRTIASASDAEANAAEFRQLHAYLQQRFPRLHAALKREVVGQALLYTWPGSDSAAKPVALLAHQDVVPVEPGTEAQWQHPPFGGVVQDGFVWGRGTWDDKGNIVAQMEAVEMLLAAGFQPRQTVYLAYGADEEVGGTRGAQQVAKLLQQRGVRLDFVLDEGLFIGEGLVPGVARPVALVGVAEKGGLSVALKARGVAGHSSVPPPPAQTAVGVLNAALRRLEDEPFPATLQGVAREMFETVAPEMQGFQRVALSNLWLFGPLVTRQLERAASSNTVLRTTTAITIVRAGTQANVIPAQAEAVVNFRLLPGDTRAGVLRAVREKVGSAVEVSELPGGAEPSPVSPTSAAPFQLLNRTIRSLDPQVAVTPALFVAGADAHHFTGLTDNVYRFSPVRVQAADLPRLHGTNERIAVANLAELVRFYHQLLRNLNAPNA
ncbi:MAG TPA: M20 family peptidase [Ramlibacter sp.]|uniref:M20 family peptidase n=1 Tax=Ramlibacter sp. TaxID=1917967 RepID=UPI002D80ACEB|nr:M20 family peptidase [Ramlibacter sp.]HET8745283.1 M20 family peptidase [Ramlibacter sp.]